MKPVPGTAMVTPAGIARGLAAERAMPTADGAVRVLKSERHTLIWTELLAEGHAVVKLYRHMGLFKLIRSKLLFGRRVRREFAALGRLHAAGIPCSAPLSWFGGRTRDAGFCEALVTRRIEDSRSLEQLGADGQAPAVTELTRLFRLLRRAHACGVYHGSLSPRNILVTRTGGVPEFHFIDMARSVVFPGDIAHTRMGRRDLLSLSMYIARRGGTACIPALLSAYGLAGDAMPGFLTALSRFRSTSLGRDLTAVEFGIRGLFDNRHRIRDAAWMRARLRDERGRAVEVFHRCDRSEWIATAERYWNGRMAGLREIKHHDWGGITQRGEVPGVGGCFFKRFSIGNIRYLHKPPRARRTVDHQARVEAMGFRVPEALCLVERRRAGCIVESAVVLKELADELSVNAILNLGLGDAIRCRDDRRRLLRALGREIGRRHARGIFHGDLHLGNVYCRRVGDAFVFTVIDNEEGSVWKRLPMRLRLHDLDHINRFKHKLSLTERMLMWRAYADAAGLSARVRRGVLRRVVRKSRRFWRKKGWLPVPTPAARQG